MLHFALGFCFAGMIFSYLHTPIVSVFELVEQYLNYLKDKIAIKDLINQKSANVNLSGEYEVKMPQIGFMIDSSSEEDSDDEEEDDEDDE